MNAPSQLFRHGEIRVRGARTHNLCNVDLNLPTAQLIVMTGLSGSGKSSLAFDTIFAEGQRRYLESVSTKTRALLSQLPRPDVDEISGLPPTVSVDQRTSLVPARSTLALTTEIYDYLRVLYARAGTAHCSRCGTAVTSQTVDQILTRTLQWPERSRLMILSPMVRGRRGAHKEVLERIARNGFVRAQIDGSLVDIAEMSPLDPTREHSISAVVDRVILKDGIDQRLRESIELACRESDGTCLISRQEADVWEESFYSTRFNCPQCDLSFPTPEPRTFSFNSPWGACSLCQGFGIRGTVEENEERFRFRREPCPECEGTRLQPFPRGFTFLDKSIAQLTSLTVADALHSVSRWCNDLRISPNESSAATFASEADSPPTTAESLSPEARLVAARTLPDIRQRLQCLSDIGLGYLTLDRPTRTLSGGEFQRARLAACLGTGLHGACFLLDEPTAGLHPRDSHSLLQTLQTLRSTGASVIVVEHDGLIMRAADWLVDLGPGAGSDGGRLLYSGPPDGAAQVDSPTGHYLAGRALPGLTFGSHLEVPAEVAPSSDQQLVQRRLFDEEGPADDHTSQDQVPGACLSIEGASLHNLQNVSVRIPLNRLVCVTGVSGSGKSSLIMQTLLPVAEAALRTPPAKSPQTRKGGAATEASEPLSDPAGGSGSLQQALFEAECRAVDGLQHLDRVVSMDNSPMGRSSRSCIVTITGIWNQIRQLFTKTKDARARGYTSARFSFNSGEGRCSLCRGTGVQNLEMKFLPNVSVQCPQCRGQRFNRATLSVHFKGKSAADVLQMRIDEACEFFSEIRRVAEVLTTLKAVGLGYLQLGQPSSTFSGGEAQRVRLASELTDARQAPALYILDEPTSGLHPADVGRLLLVLRQLVSQGHSVIVVEHQVDVMCASDWIIDVGPDCGHDGGQIVAQGTPAMLINTATTFTADALRTHTEALSQQNPAEHHADTT